MRISTKLHAPELLAVAVPNCVPPSETVTMELDSAVPLTVNVLSLVIPSVAETPVSSAIPAIAGAAGAAVSMTTASGLETVVFPFSSWTREVIR